MDIAEGSSEELDAERYKSGFEAGQKGISAKVAKRIWDILMKHKRIFRIGLEKSEPSHVSPMKINVNSDKKQLR